MLVLDSLEDPQNVGTLLRSAEAAGVHGVLFPTRRQAPLARPPVKASAGAIEHLLLCPVDDLPGALADLHVDGLRIAGSEADAPLTARQTDLRGPLAIVVGSEGQGLGPAVRRRCDPFMRIPMRGAIGSLNAAVAGSVLLFEAVAQRDPSGAGRGGRRAPTGAEAATPRSSTAATVASEPSRRRDRDRAVPVGRARRQADRNGAGKPTKATPPKPTAAATAKPPSRAARRGRRAAARPTPKPAPKRPHPTGPHGHDRSGRRRPSPPTRTAKPPRSAPRRQGRRDADRDSPIDRDDDLLPDAQPARSVRRSRRQAAADPATLDPSRRAGPIIPRRRVGSAAVCPCASRRRSSIGRAAVL